MGFETIDPNLRVNIQRNLIKMETNENNIVEENNVWEDQEIQQLLAVIDVTNLSNDLAGENFASTAIDVIKNGLSMAGYDRSSEHVENMLKSLKTAYLTSREALLQGTHYEMCPYYDSLSRIWSSCNNSDSNKREMDVFDRNICSGSIDTTRFLRGKMSNLKSPLWSDEETMELLNLIDEMDLITDFRHRLSPTTIKTLVIPLANRGYTRTCNQIIGRMRSLRENYLKCIRTGRASQAVNNCPFFGTMDKMFQRLLINNDVNSLQPIDHDYDNKFAISDIHLNTSTQKHDESVPMRQPIQSLTGHGRTSYQSIGIISNDRIDEDFLAGEFGVITFENGTSNGCNSPIEIGSNRDAYVNSSTDSRPGDDVKVESFPLRSHIDTPNGDEEQLKTKMFPSDFPRYIRIVKGKSKYILKKIDSPKNIKTEPTPYKRSHSPLKKSNSRTMVLSHSETEKPPSPIRITMTKKFKNKTVPFDESRVQLEPTSSQTDLINNNSLSETLKTMMEQILIHQEEMQRQHHEWMEKQFEIQRQHDRELRQFLLDELREFRKELRDVTEQIFTD